MVDRVAVDDRVVARVPHPLVNAVEQLVIGARRQLVVQGLRHEVLRQGLLDRRQRDLGGDLADLGEAGEDDPARALLVGRVRGDRLRRRHQHPVGDDPRTRDDRPKAEAGEDIHVVRLVGDAFLPVDGRRREG